MNDESFSYRERVSESPSHLHLLYGNRQQAESKFEGEKRTLNWRDRERRVTGSQVRLREQSLRLSLSLTSTEIALSTVCASVCPVCGNQIKHGDFSFFSAGLFSLASSPHGMNNERRPVLSSRGQFTCHERQLGYSWDFYYKSVKFFLSSPLSICQCIVEDQLAE